VTHTSDECKLLAVDRMLTLDDELDESECVSLYFLPEMMPIDFRDIYTFFRESLIERIAPSEYRDIIMIICHICRS
jgi:hypothetical protein